MAYRPDVGLADLYKRWDEAEKVGEPTARTRVRSLSSAFDKHRPDAANTAPDLADNDTRLDLALLDSDDMDAPVDLNSAVLEALGWILDRHEELELTSGDKTITIPSARRCNTPSGLLLIGLDGVFATDPATVVADKTASTGTLLEPVRWSRSAVADLATSALGRRSGAANGVVLDPEG
ncbi:MAG: hypothetical protein KDB21_19715 [Acidimicrobiales bacterium]|nr:hypothetical protein [Acidimicrobiales bacterium]